MAARTGVSKSSPSSVGMMDAAFFVGRNELLRWVNDLLGVNCPKVEACCSGAIYCQILDSCHPGKVPMKKVNWMARSEHEHIPNYKILQASFDKIGVQRNVDVDKMIRGKYQDNLEFLQWMKCYFDHTYSGHEYDPFDRREGKQVPDWCHPASQAPAPGGTSSSSQAPAPGAARNKLPQNKKAGSSTVGSLPPEGSGAGGVGRSNTMPSTDRERTGGRPGGGNRRGSNEEVEQMKVEMEDLRITVDGLETERDYYFQKLREIEIMTQTLDPADPANQVALSKMDVPGVVKEVQRILYKETNDTSAENQGG